ncbi:uncharacterized protein [Centruroides vittatus]|uniref:uncharacterized protein n=1 Tax=Centruroides vittatus TaxID=120091 RepID=UPI0035102596
MKYSLNLYDRAIDDLWNNYGFNFLRVLNLDLKGCIVSVTGWQNRNKIAAKIIKKATIGELKLWPKLLHPNILPLYERIRLDETTVAFIIPLKSGNVLETMKREHFKNYFDSFFTRKNWLFQILCGLNFLHQKGLYHLNMKLENVLISSRSNVAICGFQFITTENIIEDPKKIGCRKTYLPPEVYSWKKNNNCIKYVFVSEKIDMWSFGIIALEIITGKPIEKHSILWRRFSTEWMKWNKGIETMLKRILNDPHQFKILLSNAYPMIKFQPCHICIVMDFLKQFIKKNSTKRSSAEDGMKHDLFYVVSITAIDRRAK